jgi:hypothetical protein
MITKRHLTIAAALIVLSALTRSIPVAGPPVSIRQRG